MFQLKHQPEASPKLIFSYCVYTLNKWINTTKKKKHLNLKIPNVLHTIAKDELGPLRTSAVTNHLAETSNSLQVSRVKIAKSKNMAAGKPDKVYLPSQTRRREVFTHVHSVPLSPSLAPSHPKIAWLTTSITLFAEASVCTLAATVPVFSNALWDDGQPRGGLRMFRCSRAAYLCGKLVKETSGHHPLTEAWSLKIHSCTSWSILLNQSDW